MRVVLDANVLVSGAFWSGPPFRVLSLWAADQVQVLASEPILQEYAAALRDLGLDRGELHLSHAWIAFIFQHASLIDVRTAVDACRDPDDDKYLACAVDGGADFIVSGDGDLLAMKAFRGIPIVSPRRFLEIVT
jgi:putative PIN family toxin of toxin-antitoxin system